MREEEAVRRRDTALTLAAAVVVAAAMTVDLLGGGVPGEQSPTDWLFLLSAVAGVRVVVLPLARDPTRRERYRAAFAGRTGATLAGAYLGLFAVVGVLGPVVVPEPLGDPAHAYLPPVGFTVDAFVAAECLGPVVENRCHGTLAHPLGTDPFGRDVLLLLVRGTRVSLEVAVVASALVVPVGTAVGVVAGSRRGWTDTLLMRYVDVQETVPAFVVYVLLAYVYGRHLWLVVLAFGLLGWGSIARLVRSETIRVTESSFVEAGRVAGVGRIGLLRRYVLPNVADSVIVAAFARAPALILVEAALAYMKLTDLDLLSWGAIAARGLDQFFPLNWWVSAAPAVALVVTAVAASVVGDAARDALDRGSSTVAGPDEV
ncbi:ABC transporter permease [Halorarum halophilum]|uniref:ABC transporter permease n=1 Tax=Halorarum halophilum TaxID=2743090 RepID=A0A7D5KMB9_9EURY|nr:ABC transporter permease [Halobaculum halophilum]QLG27582.1 ABC transporter permease [Halobaculum halophilum]